MAKLFKGLSSRVSEIFEVAGIGILAYGVSMVYVPAGVIVAGIGLAFVGFALGSGDSG